MRLLLCVLVVGVSVYSVVCPPVAPNPKPVEGDSDDEDPRHEDWDDFADDADTGFGVEYEKYLREVVTALEEDEAFRKKLEEMNISDIKNGQIARHLDLVSHQIREKLDEYKRHEMQRLRELARQKVKAMNGVKNIDMPQHVDVKNPHSFEMKDLESLIVKATRDLDEIDKKRRGEFKEHEMEKEHEKREELAKLNEEERKAKEQEYEDMAKRHKEHQPVHHPGSKAQLEDVWEKSDHMDPTDFDPKTFFNMHDIDGDGQLDQEEVEALFQKELDQVYDPNMPEDDMRERYEDMARMREHVFGELDKDKDHFINMDEFLAYTASKQFENDEGWDTVDEQQNFTDEEFEQYEKMLREHEDKMKQHLGDGNQPGMVPVGQDPSVHEMQMPQGLHPEQQAHLEQQQQLHQQQQQQQLHQQQQQQQLHQQQQQQQLHQQQQQQQQQLHQQQQQVGQLPLVQGQGQPVAQVHPGQEESLSKIAGGQESVNQQEPVSGGQGHDQGQAPVSDGQGQAAVSGGQGQASVSGGQGQGHDAEGQPDNQGSEKGEHVQEVQQVKSDEGVHGNNQGNNEVEGKAGLAAQGQVLAEQNGTGQVPIQAQVPAQQAQGQVPVQAQVPVQGQVPVQTGDKPSANPPAEQPLKFEGQQQQQQQHQEQPKPIH